MTEHESVMDHWRKEAAKRWRNLEAEFPYWHSFLTDGAPTETDDMEWLTQVVEPWLRHNVAPQDYASTGDPAGFVSTVMFKDKALFDRFHAACIVGSPSFARRAK